MKTFEEVTHAEMVTILAKQGHVILAELTPHKCEVMHHAGCLMEEVGELAVGVYNGDLANIIEELGDIEFYFEGFCQAISIQVPHGAEGRDSTILPLSIAAANVWGSVKPYLFYNEDLVLGEVYDAACAFRIELDKVYAAYSMPVADAKDANKTKLSKRYHKLQFSNAQAQERADKRGVTNG